MTNWRETRLSADRSHHTDLSGGPLYAERFDDVLKFHAPGLAPVQREEDGWHIHVDGSPAYTRRLQRTFGFYEGLAAVISADGWHHIEPTGADRYPARYTWCGNFQGGRCTVRSADGRYHHITPSGEPAYQTRWRYAGDFRDGIGVVQDDSGRSTHIDTNGKILHGRWFLDLDVFHKGFARARDGDGWTHINARGEPIYSRRFSSVEPFYNGQARAERHDGGLEVIDELGQRLIELRPPLRSEFAALSGDLVGFWRTQTIAAAVKLGVFEVLPSSPEELEQRCRLRAGTGVRLLRALGELALVEQDKGAWKTTPRGAFLGAGHPLTLADAALEYAGPFSSSWAELPQALQADGGWRPPDIFGEVAQDTERLAGHHRMLRSYARHDYADMPAALRLSGDEHVIDAGGGLGAMARGLLSMHPALRVTVLDRPEVIAQARQAELPTGLQLCAADLFAPWPLEADAILLARVLHDWSDEDAIRILQNAQASLRPGGTLHVIEMLLPEEGVSGGLCDLHLLMATGGAERTERQYNALLQTAGLSLREVRALPALPSVLVARR